jgi:peptidoglycan hydrolase-like protein with peptidoglycan-binding domain
MKINMKKIILSIFALSILLPTLAFASFDTSLKYGSRGDAVIELQDFLQDQGVFTGKVDGRFGLGTRKSVIAFQLANGLQGDGYFGLGSRTKANSILALTLQPSTNAEQAETGTTTTASIVAGCTSNSAYSATTGQPCNSTTQPTTPNLPAGCTSTSGFSITTGQACNGVASTIQQLQQTVQQQAQTIQQIQQNTQQLVQNTTPVDVCLNISGVQTYVPSGMTTDSSNNCIAPPASKKDLQIINLTPKDIFFGDSVKFKVTVLDDNGNIIRNPFFKMESNTDNSSYLSQGASEIFYTPSQNQSGDIVVTFLYEPLNLTRTVTITVKRVTPTPLITVLKSSSFSDSNVQKNTLQQKIGSFTVTSNTYSETFRITNLKVSLFNNTGTALTDSTTPTLNNFSNIKTSETSGNGATPTQPASTNTFSVDSSLGGGATKTIDIFADISPIASGSFTTKLIVTGLGSASNVAYSQNSDGVAVTGQTITIQ